MRRHTLADGEVYFARSMRVTTPARTAFDLGRRLLAQRHRGARGIRQLRRTLDLIDGGAELPYEPTTRILLVQCGFPRPQTQVPVYDEGGRLLARIDIGWPECRVGVDFEGKHHWTDASQRDWDVERYAKIADVGWRDCRVTARILHNRRADFFDRVGAALISRGCPKTW